MADRQPQDTEEQQSNRHSRDLNSAEVSISRGKLSTGHAAIDLVLGGGIPRDSLYVLTGPPGAGKTIFAQQISFTAAKAGLRAIYFTNVSEPHAKIVEHIRGFDFYQPDLIGERIQIYNITSQVRTKGFKETLNFIVDTVRSEKADLVIIDSFRGLKHVLEISVRSRGAIFDAAAQLSILGCTSILVGEYTPDEIQTEPEFAIADGIINLAQATEGMAERRTFRIGKMRGVRYLSGEHSFEIDQSGIRLYPRQESLTHAPSYRATEERVSTGLRDLDEMMHGGPIRSSSTLIVGSAGAGKTLLSLHFLAAGAQVGERGLLVSFQENPEQLRIRAEQFGIGGSLGLEDGLTEVLALSPVELNLDAAAYRIREAVIARNVRHVVIDSVAELEFAVRDPDRFDDFLASLVGFLREHEVTTVMTREITQLFGTELTIASRGLSYIVDNIVLLRYIELHGEIKRAITVLKNRGSNHDKRLRELLIMDGSIQIGDRFKNLSGVMTGMPQTIVEQPLDGNATIWKERA
ncbi:MAG TPA: ATPase domain-containing protein [Herpetosiphonaceae bacterium]